MLKIFPYLEHVRIDLAWGGPMACSANLFPQIGSLSGRPNALFRVRRDPQPHRLQGPRRRHGEGSARYDLLSSVRRIPIHGKDHFRPLLRARPAPALRLLERPALKPTDHSTRSIPMAITVIRHGITLDELDAWGSARRPRLGDPRRRGESLRQDDRRSPTDPVSAAYFGTTAGKFRMTYPFSEQATVVRRGPPHRRVHRPEHALQGRRQLVRQQGHPGALGGCRRRLRQALLRGGLRHRRNGGLRPEALPALDAANNRSRLSAVIRRIAPAALVRPPASRSARRRCQPSTCPRRANNRSRLSAVKPA